MLFPFCMSIGEDSLLLLIFPVTPLSFWLHQKLTLGYLSVLLFYPTLSCSSNTILQGTSLKRACLHLLLPICFKSQPYNWEAVSSILDEARHEKRGCAANPGKLGLIQVYQTVGLWMSVRAGCHWSPYEHCANLHCVSPNHWHETGLFLIFHTIIFTAVFKPYPQYYGMLENWA